MNSHLLSILCLIRESNYSQCSFCFCVLSVSQHARSNRKYQVWQTSVTAKLERLSISTAVLGYLWERRVLRWARDTPPPCTGLKNLNGSSLSSGANQSAGDSRTSSSTPPALMTAAATEPSHWEWIRRYCMMRLICSLQGNKVTVLPPLEWQKHHPSLQ